MNDVLGYQGKTVVVTGAASGMGMAAAERLVALGAEVYALDIAPVSVGVKETIKVDMKNPADIDAAIAALPQQIDALFNCAGVPQPPFSGLDVILINYVGLRYLTEGLLGRIKEGGSITSISSTAGMGWRPNIDRLKPWVSREQPFADVAEFVEANADITGDAYGFSKQSIIVYTMMNAAPLAKRKIRINCISPSPTDSGFMKSLKEEGGMTDDIVGLFMPAIGQYASGRDMGDVMVLLGSDLAGFISGVNLPVDYGYCAEVYTGSRDNLLSIG